LDNNGCYFNKTVLKIKIECVNLKKD
jgi:hypothetical protein